MKTSIKGQNLWAADAGLGNSNLQRMKIVRKQGPLDLYWREYLQRSETKSKKEALKKNENNIP